MVTNATGQQLPVVTAFVSYSHVDRKFGHQAKDVLGEVGIDAFLAHEDMETSEQWREPLDPLAATARTAPATAGESSAPRPPGWCALDANGRTAASSPSSGCSARATTASVSAGLATTSEVGSFPVVPVNAQQARLEVLLWVP